MMTRLEEDYVYLRQYEMADKEVVLAGVNEPIGARLTGTHGGGFTMAQIERYIQMNNDNFGDGRYGWVICRASDDVVVGEVVINEIDEDNRSGSIRIALYDPQFFGKGYGTAAMRLAVDFGFKQAKLHRISLGVFDFNPRAIHVYEKIGFKQEGILRDALLWDGEFHNEIMMSILEDEWH